MPATIFSPGLKNQSVIGSISDRTTAIEFSQPHWGHKPPATGTLDVSITVTTGKVGMNYAPCAAYATVTVSGFDVEDMTTEHWDASMHRVWYEIDWDDAGARYDVPERLPEEFRDRNKSVAKEADHIYRKPGIYFVRVWAYDASGNWGSAYTLVGVLADDFADSEVIVMSSSGDFSGAPYCPAGNRVKNIAELRTLLGTSTDRKVIYAKRGDTYDMNAAGVAIYSDQIWRPWGQGADPVFHNGVRSTNHLLVASSNVALRLQGLKFTGSWDAVSEKSTETTDVRYMPDVLLCLQSGLDLVVDGCSENGTAMFAEIGSANGRITINEHFRTNYKNFMFLVNGLNLSVALMGFREHQVPGAANGVMNREEFNTGDSDYRYLRNPHNGVRLSNLGTFRMDGCDVTQEQGWTLQNIFLNNAVYRLNTAPVDGVRAFLTRSVIDGSITSVHANNGSMPPVQLLARGNIVIHDPTNSGMFGVQGPGLTVQDNLIIFPDYDKSRGINRVISFAPELNGAPHELWNQSRLEATGNTIVVLTKSGNFAGDFKVIDFKNHPNVLEKNNVIYAPNAAIPLTGDWPLDQTSLGFQGRYDGLRRGFEIWVNYHTPSATTAPGASLLVPYGTDYYGNVCDQSDFTGSWTRNKIAFTSTGYHQPRGTCSFSFEAGGIRITNTSGVTWPSGQPITIIADRGTSLMDLDTQYASPIGVMKTYAVGEDSAAYGDADGWVSPFDLLGRVRRGSAHPDAVPGMPSRGALEVRLL